MNRHIQTLTLAAGIALLPAPQANAVLVDSSFGFNYVSAMVYLNDQFIPLDYVELDSLTYLGESGAQTLTMPAGFTDTFGVNYDPNTYPPTDIDGASTRTSYATPMTLAIDWNRPGQLTPWGQVYSFPTISITDITVLGVSGTLYSDSVYVVGLLDEWTDGNELDSLFTDERGISTTPPAPPPSSPRISSPPTTPMATSSSPPPRRFPSSRYRGRLAVRLGVDGAGRVGQKETQVRPWFPNGEK